MARKLNGIELTRYDDLFKTDAEREADQQERVQIVPAEQVFPYARQPYSVDRPSADLVRLMDSIERTGIAEPLIVRPRSEGGHEIISGHRRDYCAKVVGLDTRPVIVRNYSDEDADILVVDYNINRENLLPAVKESLHLIRTLFFGCIVEKGIHITGEDKTLIFREPCLIVRGKEPPAFHKLMDMALGLVPVQRSFRIRLPVAALDLHAFGIMPGITDRAATAASAKRLFQIILSFFACLLSVEEHGLRHYYLLRKSAVDRQILF